MEPTSSAQRKGLYLSTPSLPWQVAFTFTSKTQPPHPANLEECVSSMLLHSIWAWQLDRGRNLEAKSLRCHNVESSNDAWNIPTHLTSCQIPLIVLEFASLPSCCAIWAFHTRWHASDRCRVGETHIGKNIRFLQSAVNRDEIFDTLIHGGRKPGRLLTMICVDLDADWLEAALRPNPCRWLAAVSVWMEREAKKSRTYRSNKPNVAFHELKYPIPNPSFA